MTKGTSVAAYGKTLIGRPYKEIDCIKLVVLSIRNAGTETGSFRFTIAISDETISETGDNTPIVLLGSLLALSMLAGGVLLTPDIRKKLLNK